MRDAIVQIRVGNAAKKIKVRLISGETELHLGLEVVVKLNPNVVSEERNFQVGWANGKRWSEISKITWYPPIVPTARYRTK